MAAGISSTAVLPKLNATRKAYVALRLAGDPRSAPHMECAKTQDSRAGRSGSDKLLRSLLSGHGRRGGLELLFLRFRPS